MKRFIALLVTAVFIVSVIGTTIAYAASVSVSFSGPYKKEVLAGKTYTISYTFKLSGCAVGNAVISVGGAFEKVSGGAPLFHDTIPNNTTKRYKGSVKVRVKSGAALGSKGTITLSGKYNYLDSNFIETIKNFKKSYSATVVDKLTPRPVKEVKQTQWDIAADSVALLEQGGTISLDITESAKVPAAVLSDICEKKAVMDINFPGYSCRVDGNSFTVPKSLKELDLSLSMEKDETLSAAAGGADAYQLHFGHSGQFPGPVTYKIKAENNSPGDKLYLYYYYDQSGKIEGKLSAVVDENGYVEFTIFHCSSYFLSGSVIEGAMGGLAALEDNARKDEQIAQLQTAVAELEAQLEKVQENQQEQALQQETVAASQDMDIKAASGGLDVSMIEFGAIVLGALLLGILGTIIISRAGRKGRHAAAKASSDMASSDI